MEIMAPEQKAQTIHCCHNEIPPGAVTLTMKAELFKGFLFCFNGFS